MKLYLSSYRLPVPDELFRLTGKPAGRIKIALLPNAKDYYAPLAKAYKINDIVTYHAERGLVRTEVIDLLDYRDASKLFRKLSDYDVIWAVGGNTFCLRQEMKRSGFDRIITDLLNKGIVYAGDSAGAVVAGISLRGIEPADIPAFTDEVIYDGLKLIDQVIIPHADNAYFAEANEQTRKLHKSHQIVELNDADALVVDGENQKIVSAPTPEISNVAT